MWTSSSILWFFGYFEENDTSVKNWCKLRKTSVYDTMKIHGNKDRTYIEILENNFTKLMITKNIGIELTASVFNEDRMIGVKKSIWKFIKLQVGIQIQILYEKIISTKNQYTFSVWLGKEGIPYKSEIFNIHDEYPTMLEKLKCLILMSFFMDIAIIHLE